MIGQGLGIIAGQATWASISKHRRKAFQWRCFIAGVSSRLERRKWFIPRTPEKYVPKFEKYVQKLHAAVSQQAFYHSKPV